nr:uncharacterized protein LOC119175577 isoform X1 [Rhipicephalus microplus]
MLILMGGHYDISTGLYRLRIDAFLMTMTVFTFVLTSALLLMCTIMGSTELPNSVLYRINYLLATITYFPFTVGFIYEEYMHGDIKQTIAGGVLSITNSLIYMFNLCVSYELRCLKSRHPERKPKRKKSKRKGKKGKGKKGGMSDIDILMGRDQPAGATAGLSGRVRNERDLLATGDVETFLRLQQIQQMNRLLENDPIMFHQQTMLGAQQAYGQEQQQYMAQASGGSPSTGLRSGGASPAAGGGPMADEFGRRPRDDRLARRVVHEVYRGEFLPGEEYLMQPAVGKEFIIPIQVEGRKTPTTSAATSPSETSESDSSKKSSKKGSKKGSKHKKKKKKKGSKNKKKKSKKGSKHKKKHSKGKKKKKSKGKKKKKKK